MFSSIHFLIKRLLVIVFFAFTLTNCSSGKFFSKKSRLTPTDQAIYSKISQQTRINPYLWRATLETLGFLPLLQVDPQAGIILSDWHIEPQYPKERFKVTAYILDPRLRADALKINVIRQVVNKQGQWENAKVDGDTPYQLENVILTKAKAFKVKSYKK